MSVSGGSRISLGGVDPLGGRGPPTRMLFGENVYENKKIGLEGGHAPKFFVCRSTTVCIDIYVMMSSDLDMQSLYLRD